jgi:Acetyltransferase (GNAT) domain
LACLLRRQLRGVRCGSAGWTLCPGSVSESAGNAADIAAVESITQMADEEWDAALVDSGESFRFSHRAAAGRALEAAYGSYRFEPYRVTYRDGTTLLIPIVRVARRHSALTMMLSMPFSLEGTPVAVRGRTTAGHVRGLFQALGGLGLLAVHGGAGGSPPALGRVTSGVTHVLDLSPGFDAVWTDSFSSRCRNSCRKAEKLGVEVRLESTPEALAAYYRLYEAAARSWGHARAPYSRRLFDSLLNSGAAELWLARVGDRVIGGGLMLRGSDDLLYWSGAMDRRFQHAAPSNAVMRSVIESACERAIACLDFGASAGLSGIEWFKSSFGARERRYQSVELGSRAYFRLERWRSRLSRVGGRSRSWIV